MMRFTQSEFLADVCGVRFVDFQQHGRMIGRATCSRWHRSVEA